jgi:hypothetical protein
MYIIKKLVSKPEVDINRKNIHGVNVFWIAAYYG